jgi:hypothetical protein
MSVCAPIRDGKFKKGCLSKQELLSIAKLLPDEDSISIAKMSRQKIQKKLAEKLPDCGEDEMCWMENSELSTSKLVNFFKPDAPFHWFTDKNAWLSNFDILAILNQYEIKFKDFKFIGVFPLDFEKLKCDTTNAMAQCQFFDHARYTQKRFAMVLNLSKHNQRGTHWVAVFFDLNKNSKQHGVFFYDSYATKPPQLVNTFIKNIRQNLGYPIKTASNTYVHQHKGTECGVFVMNFIIKSLQNKNMTHIEICNMIRAEQTDKKDENIHKERARLFNWRKKLIDK